MILKGNQRGGGRQMALHLLNTQQNEHAHVHEVSGFMASDVLGALNEAHAISKGTQCKQFMYSLSLNPPQNEAVPVHVFEQALERIEKKLGLEGQPRVIVFHEKEGRRHCHSVYSRIDIDEMKAINMSHDRRKLNDISKSLFLEHGWTLPDGFRDKNKKNPLNYTREEWQQAARINRKPADIKRELQECWAVSDSKKSFQSALRESGYHLARGDRRGFVAIDIHGEVFSLSRQLGVKQKDLEPRLGKAEDLPSVSDTKDNIAKQLTGLFKRYSDELAAHHNKSMQPLLRKKQAMTLQHRKDRAAQKAWQEARWQNEEARRVARIRKGFKGLWDKLSGKYWKLRKQNEKETWTCFQRDRSEREDLVNKQLSQRQPLQVQLNDLQTKHEKDRQDLIRNLSHMANVQKSKGKDAHSPRPTQDKSHDQQTGKDHDHPGIDIDMEPEI